MANSFRPLPTTTLGVQRMISSIYSMGPDSYTEEMVAGLRRLAQAARGRSKEEIYLPALLDFFRWYVCLCNKLGYKLDDVLWYKYPGVCPYCGGERCSGKYDSKEPNPALFPGLMSRRGKPRTIRGWQRLIAKIYGQRNSTQVVEYLFERLRGEVDEAMEFADDPLSEQYQEPFSLEMADIGAWFFSIVTRLEIDLENEFLSRYPWKCPGCDSIPCFLLTSECR
ncbi:MAG: hypothetical protein Q8O75_02115 [bacterium]|nr:hypothetical protein [bacterium]